MSHVCFLCFGVVAVVVVVCSYGNEGSLRLRLDDIIDTSSKFEIHRSESEWNLVAAANSCNRPFLSNEQDALASHHTEPWVPLDRSDCTAQVKSWQTCWLWLSNFCAKSRHLAYLCFAFCHCSCVCRCIRCCHSLTVGVKVLEAMLKTAKMTLAHQLKLARVTQVQM